MKQHDGFGNSAIPTGITICTVTGAVLGEWVGDQHTSMIGAAYGAAVGVTLWLLVGALVDRNWTVFVAGLTVTGGMWVGWFVGGFDQILPGALWGSAMLVGYVLARVVDHFHVKPIVPILVEADELDEVA